jgi:hypothetical protein
VKKGHAVAGAGHSFGHVTHDDHELGSRDSCYPGVLQCCKRRCSTTFQLQGIAYSYMTSPVRNTCSSATWLGPPAERRHMYGYNRTRATLCHVCTEGKSLLPACHAIYLSCQSCCEAKSQLPCSKQTQCCSKHLQQKHVLQISKGCINPCGMNAQGTKYCTTCNASPVMLGTLMHTCRDILQAACRLPCSGSWVRPVAAGGAHNAGGTE